MMIIAMKSKGYEDVFAGVLAVRTVNTPRVKKFSF